MRKSDDIAGAGVIGGHSLVNRTGSGRAGARGVVASGSTITVSGVTSPSGANGTWPLDAFAPNFNGRPNYNLGIYWIQWNGTRWEFTTDMGTDYFTSTEDVADPTLVTSWTPGPGAAGTLTIVSS